MPNSDPQIQVLKFVTYIYSDAKFNRQNTSNKFEIEHPGTKEEQTTVDQVKPISANHITLRWSRVTLPEGVTPLPLHGTLAEWTSSGVDSTRTQRPTDLMPTLKFNACTGQWPKQSAKRLSFSVSVQSGCDRKSPGG